LGDEAKHLASDAMAQARDAAQAQVSSGKDRLAAGLGSVAEAIRHTGEQLREGEPSSLTDYVTRAADGVEAASDYLKEKNIGDVLGDVGGFARREPAMFLGGAFVLGLLGGRFLKSSHLQPAPVNGGARTSATESERGKQSSARTNAQPDSRGNAASRAPTLSGGAGPTNSENMAQKSRDNGGGRGSSPGNGAKLPGTV